MRKRVYRYWIENEIFDDAWVYPVRTGGLRAPSSSRGRLWKRLADLQTRMCL